MTAQNSGFPQLSSFEGLDKNSHYQWVTPPICGVDDFRSLRTREGGFAAAA